MNPVILPLLLSVGKYVLATVVLYLFYRLVFRKHASYRESRWFLLSITLFAVLVSQFRIEVTKPAPTYVQTAPMVAVMPLSTTTFPIETSTPNTNNQTSTVQANVPKTASTTNAFESIPSKIQRTLAANLGTIALTLYALVAFLLFVNLLYQFARIGKLRRAGRIESRNGFTLVHHSGIETPFSSGKTIFLPNNLNENQQDVVLQHESWHIRHRHYLDVYLQEALTCLCWFNPIQWILRKELRSIHEFETDRSVLSEGTDLFRYQTIILEEVMGNHFRLANGFNQSFTKKRFIQMKNTKNQRLAPTHKLLLAPIFTLLFAALSFVPGQSQVIKIKTNSGPSNDHAITTTSDFIMDTVSTSNPLHLDPTRITENGYIQTSYLKSLDSLQQMVNKALPAVRKLAAQTNPTANTADMNALLEAMDIKANNHGISITEFSDEARKSFTRADFKQLQSVLENTNDSLRLYRKQKVDRMDSPYLLRPIGLAQQMMSSDFVTKLFPELFQIMSRQLSGMMQGMSSATGQTPAEAEHNSKDAAEAGKMMGEMVTQLTKNLGQMTQTMTQTQPTAEVVCDTVRVSTPRTEIPDQTLINIALNDPSREVRYTALQQIDDQAIILRIALKDKDQPLRAEAINRLNDPKVLSDLAQNDPDPRIRIAALKRLSALKNQKKTN